MHRLATFLAVMWLSMASVQPSILDSIRLLVNEANADIQTLVDPAMRPLAKVLSTQCETLKKLLGLDYDSYANDAPDLSKLTLDFIARINSETYTQSYKMTEAIEEIPKSQWFNASLPFRIYFHGFTDDPSQDGFRSISNAFIEQGDFNILGLDASSLIRLLYLRSSTMVRFIGQVMGYVLYAMINAGLEPRNIHLIGHSLGAHIAAFAGQTVHNLTGELVGRISGLDPAEPCFFNANDSLRLSKGDAKFVDVIHTDTGVYGTKVRLGHVDFYPNSGSQQPNCWLQTCSHSRVVQLYAESISTKNSFIGVSAPNWKSFRDGSGDYNDTSVMGYWCPEDTRGKYYLQTAGASPFGLQEKGTRYNAFAGGIIRGILYKIRGR